MQLLLLAVDSHVLTSQGCRAGDACRYLHDASGFQQKSSPSEGLGPTNGETQSKDPIQGVATDIKNLSIKVSQPPGRPSASSSSAAPQRPVSNAESQNPREFQLNQLRRRFRPKEETNNTGTMLEFGMAPSDPDFPFDLDKLQCILYVPQSYPEQGRPKLKVVNTQMESDFQENVARGFDDIGPGAPLARGPDARSGRAVPVWRKGRPGPLSSVWGREGRRHDGRGDKGPSGPGG